MQASTSDPPRRFVTRPGPDQGQTDARGNHDDFDHVILHLGGYPALVDGIDHRDRRNVPDQALDVLFHLRPPKMLAIMLAMSESKPCGCSAGSVWRIRPASIQSPT